MQIALHLIAASVVSALGLSHANAAMLLTEDPLSGGKVVVDTDDPNYAEKLIVGPRDTKLSDLPPRSYLLTKDEKGEPIAINPANGHEYRLRQIGRDTYVLEQQ